MSTVMNWMTDNNIMVIFFRLLKVPIKATKMLFSLDEQHWAALCYALWLWKSVKVYRLTCHLFFFYECLDKWCFNANHSLRHSCQNTSTINKTRSVESNFYSSRLGLVRWWEIEHCHVWWWPILLIKRK